MVKKVIEVLYSDLSDIEIEPGDGETVEFSYRGRAYAIDLTNEEAAEFDDLMARYTGTAARVGGNRPNVSRAGGTARRGPEQVRAIREWARQNGWPNIADRGRIPGEVEDAYNAAHE